LFTALWNAGYAVLPSRGASAAADWTANRQVTMPDMRGRVPAGVDGGTGRISAVVADALGATGGQARVQPRHYGYVDVNVNTSINTYTTNANDPGSGTHVFASGGSGDATGWDHSHHVFGTWGGSGSGTIRNDGNNVTDMINTVQPTLAVNYITPL